MNPRDTNRGQRRAMGLRMKLTHSVSATHVRIPNLRHKGVAKYECRLSNKQERSFEKWNDLADFINFPPERSPELFSVCFGHRGEWIEFTGEDDADEIDTHAAHVTILYECDTCNHAEALTPIQAATGHCKCGGAWRLVPITDYKEALPSQREEKKTYDI